MASEGIEVNEPEAVPDDAYTVRRKEQAAIKTYKTSSTFDKTRQFLEMDRKVLRFYCVWDDRDSMFGEMHPYILQVICSTGHNLQSATCKYIINNGSS